MEHDGLTEANRAAVFAHLRHVLNNCLHVEHPTVGLIVCTWDALGRGYIHSAGATEFKRTLSALENAKASRIEQEIAIRTGDIENAELGDQYDEELGATRCVSCEDGDPEGAHAKEELEENARAWLGLLCEVGLEYYGEHISQEAYRLLKELRVFSLPPGTRVR